MNKVRLTLLLVLIVLVSIVIASNTIPKIASLSMICSDYEATALTVEPDVDITCHLLINELLPGRVKAFSQTDILNVNTFNLNSGGEKNSLLVLN